MPSALRPYHKGNLRERLLEETARLVAREGVAAVSMRRLGECLGISRMAAYHHFADKDALLRAVGQDGFRRLVSRLSAAVGRERTAAGRLRRSLAAYVRFALEEGEFFRLMFGDVLERPLEGGPQTVLAPYSFSSPEAREAFAALVSAVQACQDEGSLAAGDALRVTNTLWAFTHGVACLAGGSHLKLQEGVGAFFERGLDALLSGLAPPRPPASGRAAARARRAGAGRSGRSAQSPR